MPTQLLTLDGTKNKGAGYHNVNSGIQTFEFSFSNWTGVLKLQATLILDPTENDWFDIVLTDPVTNNVIEFDLDSTDYDNTVVANSKGNFVWIRAANSTLNGSVTAIRYNY